jgi:predicted ABC-type ATPase
MKIILTEEQFKHIIAEMSTETIDTEAKNVNTNPTDPQKEAGNYKMGHISIKGMKISIENPVGSQRKFKKEDGSEGSVTMKNHYGYFGGTSGNGKDGDAVDVFIGPNPEGFERVYVIDQNKKDGSFDESKVMLGFDSKEQAKEAYMSNYNPGWTGFRAITSVSLRLFKKWLYRGNKQRKPFAEYVEIQKKKLDESKIKKNILEGKIVTFDNTTYPKFGWAVIMAGGAGSGKSHILRHNLPIDGKMINKDDIGMLVYRLHPEKFKNFSRQKEGHIRKLNQMTRNGKYAERVTDNVINTANPERLPNIIIDTTSSSEENLISRINILKKGGYKICFIWVVTNRSEALVRSLTRDRRVPQSTFHSTHNRVKTIVPKFLSYCGDLVTDAWIILNSGVDLHTEQPKDFLFKLKRNGNGFIIPDELKQTIEQYVGASEVSPYGPDVYYQYNDVIGQFGSENDDGSVTIDRSKLPRTLYKKNPIDRKSGKPINNPFLTNDE